MALAAGQMKKAGFLARFGDVFEHSPWVAIRTWENGLDERHNTPAGLHQAFSDVILAADQAQKLVLLQAHPELATGVASGEELTAASKSEQRGAGLDRCSPEEFADFQALNTAYRDKYGFPFIMAVKGYNRQQIMQAFRARLGHTQKQEFRTALDQVIRIGLLRIESKFGEYV